jgi:hypothetical protein
LNRRTTVKVLDIYWEKPKPIIVAPPKTPGKPGAKPAPGRAVPAPKR